MSTSCSRRWPDTDSVIPGWSEGPDRRCAIAHRGISRFRARCCASPPNDATRLLARKFAEFLHHALIDRSLERHDQPREILHRFPAPVDEFGLVAVAGGRDIDLGILAGEAQREPFLALAPITALPGAAGDSAR